MPPSPSSSATTMPTDAEAARQKPRFHGLRDGAIRPNVKLMFKMFLVMMACVTLLLWTVLPLFWGSTWLLEHYFYRLNMLVVDFDSSPSGSGSAAILGPAVTQGVLQDLKSPVHLGWEVKNSALFPGGPDDIRNRVINNAYWGAVVINSNATSLWREALQTGNSTYDPTGSIAVYVSSARFYQVIREYELQLVQAVLQPIIAKASLTATQSFFSSFGNDTGTGASTNSTALQAALASPAALGQVFGYHVNDLIPIQPGTWAIGGPLGAGLLYSVIFCFQLVLWENDAFNRTGLKSKLTMRSLIALRLAVPCILYFFFSLWYTCIISAFQIPLTNVLGHSGWLATWALNYLSFLSLGLALEVAITWLGIRWMPFFLITWIILNITSSFLPIALMENFYEWLKWTPFYNSTSALKTIVYGQHGRASRIGLNYGVLIATALVNMCTLSLGCVFERWRNARSAPPPGPTGPPTTEKQEERETADVDIDEEEPETAVERGKRPRRDGGGGGGGELGEGGDGEEDGASAEGSAVVEEKEVKE